jgi:hypothetical protein
MECAFVAMRNARALADSASHHAHEAAARAGDLRSLAYAHLCSALVCYQFGELKVACKRIQTGHALLRKATWTWYEACATEFWGLWTLAYLGETRELVSRVSQLLAEAEARGDLYLATNLCLGRLNLAWLVRDDPDGARQAARGAIARWSQDGYQLQHYYALYAEVNGDLYTGDGVSAWRRIDADWGRLRRSLLLGIRSVRSEAWNLRARAALAAAAAATGWRRRKLLRVAVRATRRVERAPTPVAQALWPLQAAAIAHLRGDTDGALTGLRDTIAAAENADMALHAACARRRLGGLLGGAQGRALIDDADAWMAHQDILNPARMTALFAPGFDRGDA